MPPKKWKASPELQKHFGHVKDEEIARTLVKKLIQYNTKYNDIIKTVMTHSERAFVDARLEIIESCYHEAQKKNDSVMERYLANIMAHPELIASL